MKRFHILHAGLALALSAGAASAQVWGEVGDAPDGPLPFQDTVGIGALESITGSIDRGNGDHVDTYCIMIVDVAAFFASTKQSLGGFASTATGGNADTRLYLWDLDGNIVLANDDDSGSPDGLASTITDPSTFNAVTGGVVNASASNISLTPGQYLLSITYFPNNAVDSGGFGVSTIGSPFSNLHGPNPNAGAFNNWTNPAGTTAFDYRIALGGVEYSTVPTPGGAALLGLAGLVAIRRRR